MIEDQPPPTKRDDLKPAWESVIADILKWYHQGVMGACAILVIEDTRERDAVGRKRYGTPLTALNGRDQMVDAYQEALDLVVYLRARLDEGASWRVETMYGKAVELAIDLRQFIEDRKSNAT